MRSMPRHFVLISLAVCLYSTQLFAEPPRPMKPGTLGPSPNSTAADDILPPPPPIPDPPAEKVSPAKPTPAIGPSPLDVKPPAAHDDPFQQVPRDPAKTSGNVTRAS